MLPCCDGFSTGAAFAFDDSAACDAFDASTAFAAFDASVAGGDLKGGTGFGFAEVELLLGSTTPLCPGGRGGGDFAPGTFAA